MKNTFFAIFSKGHVWILKIFLPEIAHGISFEMIPKLQIAHFIGISKDFLATRVRCALQPEKLAYFSKELLRYLYQTLLPYTTPYMPTHLFISSCRVISQSCNMQKDEEDAFTPCATSTMSEKHVTCPGVSAFHLDRNVTACGERGCTFNASSNWCHIEEDKGSCFN